MKKKLIVLIFSFLIVLIFILTPVLAFGSVMASPFKQITNMFGGFGELVNGDNSTIELLNFYLEKGGGSETIKEIRTYIEQTNKKVPLEDIVIPLFMSGDIDDKKMYELIDVMLEQHFQDNKLITTEKYINNLRTIEPFKSGFNDVSTTSILEYIKHFSWMSGTQGLDVENIKGWIYILENPYPLGDGVGWYNPFGDNPIQHNGQDIQVPCGVPQYAPQDAIVTSSATVLGQNDNGGRGYYVEMATVDNYIVRLFHFESPTYLQQGTHVKKGQFVGFTGTTGMSTGCHAHYEVRDLNWNVMNPLSFFDNDKWIP